MGVRNPQASASSNTLYPRGCSNGIQLTYRMLEGNTKFTSSNERICRTIPTTPTPTTPSNYFRFSSKKNCAGNGKDIIRTEAACNVAAADLKLSDTTATDKESSLDPKGCWYDVDLDMLFFNKKSSSDWAFSLSEQGICKKPPAQVVKANCVYWRQTGGCKPDGTREPDADKPCWETISSGASGYCECKNGNKKESTCDHGDFTCNDACGDRRMLRHAEEREFSAVEVRRLFMGKDPANDVPRGYYTLSGQLPTGNIFNPRPKEGYTLALILPPQYSKCYDGDHIWMVLLSVLVLIFFSLAFPRLMGKVIEKEKPKALAADDPENPVVNPPVLGNVITMEYLEKKALYDEFHGKPVIFNDEGRLVEYTDEIFLIEVNKQNDSPFTTMYKGFEMRWAKYKVYVMDLKLVQLFCMTLSTCDILSRNILTPQTSLLFASIAAIATTGLFLGLSCRASPYVDTKNDRMEMVSKITLIITPVMLLLSALLNNAQLALVVGLLLNLTALLGNLFMLWMMISAMACCKTRIKLLSGTLTFSAPDGLSAHNDHKTLPDWNLDAERKRRIWKPFWNKILHEDPELSGCWDKEKHKKEIEANDGKLYLPNQIIESYGDPKYEQLVSFDAAKHNAVCKILFPLERFDEMLRKLRSRGFEAFQSGMLPLPQREFQMRLQFQTLLEGPDLFCDDHWTIDPTHSAVKDGRLQQTSNGFGRLVVDPYPYCLEIHWDGKKSHDQAEVPSWGAHKYRLQELWNMQLRPDVVRMKAVRLQLRGAAAGKELYNPYERDEHTSRQIKDGLDDEGKQKYKTENYTIHWKYTHGQVRIKSDFGEEHKFDQGFHVGMWYHDGQGVEINGSQKGKKHKKGMFNMKEDQMGINHTNYQMTDALHRILTQKNNGVLVAKGITKYNEKLQQFRRTNLRERYWENYALSWSFWYLIYNNDMISLSQMTTHFKMIEQNPKFHNLVEKYDKELTAITKMVAYFNTHPCVGYWYTYWSDVYKMNSDLPGIKANEDMFNSAVSTSICFKPMGRKETDAFLSSAKGKSPLGKNQKAHLDLLFAKVDAIKLKHPMKTIVGNPVFVPVVVVPVYVVPAGEQQDNTTDNDGSSVWVDFAKSPVVVTAIPNQVPVVDCYVETNNNDVETKNQIGQQSSTTSVASSIISNTTFDPVTGRISRGNENQVGLHTNLTCKEGHGLIRYKIFPRMQSSCDLCGHGPLPTNSITYGCDKCNFDVCTRCEELAREFTNGQDFSDSEEEEHTLDLEPAIVIAGKLPEGWSLETTGDGKMYYIKQKDKKTAKWKAPNGSLDLSNLHVNGVTGSQIQWKFGTGILPSSSNTADYYPEGQPTPLTYKDAAASPVTGLDATLKKNGNQSFAEGLYYAVDKATSIKLIPFDPENRAATTPTGLVEDRYYEVENLVGQTNERYIAGTIFKANVCSRDMLAPCTVHPVAYGDFVWEGEKFVMVDGKKLTAPKCSKCSKPMILEDCDDSSKNCDKCHGSRGGWWCRECNTVICLDCKHHYLGMT